MEKKTKLSRRIVVTLFALMMALSCIVPAAAYSDDYVVRDQVRYPIPEVYSLYESMNTFGFNAEGEAVYLKEPTDIYLAESGNIFIADTGNNRIVKFYPDNTVEFFDAQGTLKAPEGICVFDVQDPDTGVIYEHMLVADTGNSRIVHLAHDGEFIEEITKPESEILANVTFNITKITLSTTTGYIYATAGENIMTLDANGNFRGYIGQSEIGFQLVEWFLRMFASEEQLKGYSWQEPDSYTNITTGYDGMIYASSRDKRLGQLKILNTVGDNIYREYGTSSAFMQWINGLLLPDAYKESFKYGETRKDNGKSNTALFVDIATDRNGIVYGLEQSIGRIYIYDQSGTNLAVFGNKAEDSKSAIKGQLVEPVALAVDPNTGFIYVLDKRLANIQVFKPTEFIDNIFAAVTANYNGEYDKAKDIWTDVLEINENYEIAYQGLGRTLYKEEDYIGSMAAYEQANDRSGYSKAFAKQRYIVFREYFVPIVAAILVIVVGAYFLIRLAKKTADKSLKATVYGGEHHNLWGGLRFSLNSLFHPNGMFEEIKYNRAAMNVWSATFLFGLYIVAKLFYIFVVHYPLADLDMRDTNLVLEIVKLLIIPALWIIGSFAVTSIFSGEMKLRDSYIATAYCLLPHIIVLFVMPLFSRVLSLDDSYLYKGVILLAVIWCAVLCMMSLIQINGYSFGRGILSIIGVVIAMAIIVVVAILLYVLVGRLFEFASGVIDEAKMALG